MAGKDLKGEIFRKTVHLLAYVYAVILYSSKGDLIVFVVLPLLVVLVDFLRIKFKPLMRLIYIFVGNSIKEHEKRNLSDATVMAVGIWISILIFGKYALVGLAVSIFGDAFASIFGKLFGKIGVFNNKTLEGFLAFVLVSLLLGVLSGELVYMVFITGILCAFVEILSPPLENLSLGFFSSLTFFLLMKLVQP